MFLILISSCNDSELREDYRFRMNAIEGRLNKLECGDEGMKLCATKCGDEPVTICPLNDKTITKKNLRK